MQTVSKLQNNLSYNCGEMEYESEGKISYDHAIEAALVFRTHWQVKAEISVRQLPELISAQNSCNNSQNAVGQHL